MKPSAPEQRQQPAARAELANCRFVFAECFDRLLFPLAYGSFALYPGRQRATHIFIHLLAGETSVLVCQVARQIVEQIIGELAMGERADRGGEPIEVA